jgi:hypothetical protein
LADQGVPALSAKYVPLYMDYVSQGITGSQEKWTDCLKNVARFVNVENGHLNVKFDEIGVLSFGHKVPGVLATSVNLHLPTRHFTLPSKLSAMIT